MMDGRIEGPGARRILYLDGWRGAAITLVIIGHFFFPNTPLASAGVEVFFVLSGRLMAEILFVEKYPIKRFFLKRFARIYPALLAFVVIAFFVLHNGPLSFKPQAALAGILLIYNYLGPYVSLVPAIDHLWSLCVEEHSYILLAIIAWGTRKNPKMAMWIIGAMALLSFADAVVSGIILNQPFQKLWRTDAHIGSVFVSVWLYIVVRPYFSARPRLGAWMPALGLGGAALVYLFAGAVFNTAGTAMLALAVCTLDFAPGPILALLSWRGLTFVGTLSYSLYLWQQPISKLVDAGAVNPWLGLAGSVAAGLVSLYLIEKPARNFINSRFGRLRFFQAREAVNPA